MGVGEPLERHARFLVSGERVGKLGRHLDDARLVIHLELDRDPLACLDARAFARLPVEAEVVGSAVAHQGRAERVAVDGRAHRDTHPPEDLLRVEGQGHEVPARIVALEKGVEALHGATWSSRRGSAAS